MQILPRTMMNYFENTMKTIVSIFFSDRRVNIHTSIDYDTAQRRIIECHSGAEILGCIYV